MNPQAFVLIACRRTGSNYLMNVFDSFPEMEFFGEVYHNKTVWMPIERKKEYVKWLANTHNIKIEIGDKPFEDKDLIELNHDRPEHFIDFLTSTTKYRYAGFKIFPEHLRWQKLRKNILANKKVIKIILKRNLLDVYISDKILNVTRCSQKQDTSNIKINFNCLNFKTWYFSTQSFYSRIELFLNNHGQAYSELYYEELHEHDRNEEKTVFLKSWLNRQGIDVNEMPEAVSYTKKQDKRKHSLAKVENAEEVERYLKQHHLQHLVRS